MTEPVTMGTEAGSGKRAPSRVRRWVRVAFLVWAVTSQLWLANKVRTRGVDPALLRTSEAVSVVDGDETLELVPTRDEGRAALVFFCGAGVAAPAYAPLLRPIAEAGHPVFIVKLPYRFAPLQSHKAVAAGRARRVMASHPAVPRWVVSGHSLGAALACRLAKAKPAALSGLVLIGTTHPKEADLSALAMPVTKVYGSNDGVAPRDRVLANRDLLPSHTRWVEIEGGNHSQFGHYGHQLFDGDATLTREAQQEIARTVLLEALAELPGDG